MQNSITKVTLLNTSVTIGFQSSFEIFLKTVYPICFSYFHGRPSNIYLTAIIPISRNPLSYITSHLFGLYQSFYLTFFFLIIFPLGLSLISICRLFCLSSSIRASWMAASRLEFIFLPFLFLFFDF